MTKALELEGQIAALLKQMDTTKDAAKYADTVLRLLLHYQELTREYKSELQSVEQRHECIAAAALMGEQEAHETAVEPIVRLVDCLSRIRAERDELRAPSISYRQQPLPSSHHIPDVELEVLQESRRSNTLLTAGLALLGLDLIF